MPYQYEYDKSLKTYSITIDLEMVGKDDNFQEEAEAEEKAERVCMLLNACLLYTSTELWKMNLQTS